MPEFFRYHRGEKTALRTIEQARNASFNTLFRGTQFQFSSFQKSAIKAKLAWHGGVAARNAAKLGKAAGVALPGVDAQQFAKDFVNVSLDGEVLSDVLFMAEIAAEIAPVAGAIYSSAMAVKGWRDVFRNITRQEKAQIARPYVPRGDPTAAVDAVIRIINREIKLSTAGAARHTTAASVKIAGLFADLGAVTTPVVGLANALAGIGLELARLAVDLREMRQGNELLKNLDALESRLDVFEACPILGCYFLTCADTSTILDFFLTDIVDPHADKGEFMTKIEHIKFKKLDPMLLAASEAIESSNIKLEGLKADKGAQPTGMVGKLKNNFTKSFRKFVRANGRGA